MNKNVNEKCAPSPEARDLRFRPCTPVLYKAYDVDTLGNYHVDEVEAIETKLDHEFGKITLEAGMYVILDCKMTTDAVVVVHLLDCRGRLLRLYADENNINRDLEVVG